jgi:drug/metabolite transporter (DMT)-like permease
LDYVFFRAIPGPLTVLGAAIIVGATLYIALREARLRAAAPRP